MFDTPFAPNRKGFTLIEVMVVLSIIGILVAILVLNFDESRKQSRDQARKSDLQAMQLAIETYKAQNGSYPAEGCGAPPYPAGGGWVSPGPMSAGWATSCTQYIAGLAPDFIPQLATDPNQENDDNKGYLYTTNADRSAYKLLVHWTVESSFVNSFADEFARCPRSCGSCPTVPNNIYGVYSEGAECW